MCFVRRLAGGTRRSWRKCGRKRAARPTTTGCGGCPHSAWTACAATSSSRGAARGSACSFSRSTWTSPAHSLAELQFNQKHVVAFIICSVTCRHRTTGEQDERHLVGGLIVIVSICMSYVMYTRFIARLPRRPRRLLGASAAALLSAYRCYWRCMACTSAASSSSCACPCVPAIAAAPAASEVLARPSMRGRQMRARALMNQKLTWARAAGRGRSSNDPTTAGTFRAPQEQHARQDHYYAWGSSFGTGAKDEERGDSVKRPPGL